jgi:hypothetical protein
MIECDDCIEGPVAWANDQLEDKGYSVRADADTPLDASSVVTRSDFRTP